MYASGLRVQGLGFGFQDLGFRVEDLAKDLLCFDPRPCFSMLPVWLLPTKSHLNPV